MPHEGVNTPPRAPLDDALGLERVDERQYRLATSETYWNLTGPFGGWVFAAGAKAILLDDSVEGEPVEAHARFIAAPKEGVIDIRVMRLSQGRSVGFWRAEIWQEQKGAPRLCAEVSMLFAAHRTTIDVVTARPPVVPAPEALRAVNTPMARLRWLGVYDLRYVSGAPFAPADPPSMESVFWARERVARKPDWLGLIALADIVAPRSFALQPARMPSATVSMSVYFTATSSELAAMASGWMLLAVNGHAARRGFFDHALSIWQEDRLLLTSTQMAWFA
jgi:hypothetical protein